MPATIRGIYHNLKESIYAVTNGEIYLYFSSELYQTKFINGYMKHRKKFFKHLPDTPLNMETLADITFYKMIEKRGFRSCLKGVNLSCDETHQYALRKMTGKNTENWSKTQGPKLHERLKIME